jgi:hypothetical protein
MRVQKKYTVLPFTDSNNLKTKHLHLWMRGRRAFEQQQEKPPDQLGGSAIVVDCPALPDVVFKTGTSNLNHPGNAEFHEMLRNQSDDSEMLPYTVSMIFDCVTKRNGRFLEWDSFGYWKVISDQGIIEDKIYNTFFYAKKTSNARKCRQSNSSSTFQFERQDGRKRKRAPDGTEVSLCAECCKY